MRGSSRTFLFLRRYLWEEGEREGDTSDSAASVAEERRKGNELLAPVGNGDVVVVPDVITSFDFEDLKEGKRKEEDVSER